LPQRLGEGAVGQDLVRMVDPSTGAEQWLGWDTDAKSWQTWDDPRRYYPGDPAEVLSTAETQADQLRLDALTSPSALDARNAIVCVRLQRRHVQRLDQTPDRATGRLRPVHRTPPAHARSRDMERRALRSRRGFCGGRRSRDTSGGRSTGAPLARRCWRRTSEAPSWPAARPGR
jgi:hypothetical protein